MFDTLSETFEFPESYITADLETFGFSFDRDPIMSLGYARVQNRVLVDVQEILLDWTRYPHIDHQYLQYRIGVLEEAYAKKGREFHYSWARLRNEGVPVLEGLYEYSRVLYEQIAADEMIMGHAFTRFDRRMLDTHTSRYLQGYLLPWRESTILDTGLLEKAAQLNLPPHNDESISQWMSRLQYIGSKVKWSLDGHCVPKYGLVARHSLDMRFAHSCGFDCRMVHHLVETYRELAADKAH
jgi:hypothetical protein